MNHARNIALALSEVPKKCPPLDIPSLERARSPTLWKFSQANCEVSHPTYPMIRL